MKPTLIIATANPGKLRDFAELLDLPGVQIIAAGEAGVQEWPPETGETFAENANAKTRYAMEVTGLPALGDDSGLIVDALGGIPGVYSARYGGAGLSARDRYLLLLANLIGVPAAQRTARFVSALAFVLPNGTIHEAQGQWEGTIADAPRGVYGFGYDPIFIPAGDTRTAGELSDTEKSVTSHRARAFAALRPALVRYFVEEGTHDE